MKVCPLREAQPPRYPRRTEVSSKEIKAAIPKRWVRNRAAKAALAALSATALTGCASAENCGAPVLIADAGNIVISIDGKELAAATPVPTAISTALQKAEVTTIADMGMPNPPTIWPFYIAAGLALGIVICVGSRVLRKRKKHSEKIDKAENAKAKEDPEPEYEEGEY